jgi:hypothetical protein
MSNDDRDASAISVLLNILATLGFLAAARTPPHTATEILAIAAVGLGVFGTALVPITIQREWLRVSMAALVIVLAFGIRTALLQG